MHDRDAGPQARAHAARARGGAGGGARVRRAVRWSTGAGFCGGVRGDAAGRVAESGDLVWFGV